MAEDNMSNIVNNLKNMLHNNIDSNNSNTDSNPNDKLNITPEMINNLATMLQQKNNQSHSTKNNSSAPNSSNPKASQAPHSNKDSHSTTNDSSQSASFFDGNIDLETILKMKSIFETLNQKDDPRSNLLYSLKPYLRETRQKKLDQYVNLLKITKVTNLFKSEKGDEN